MITVMLRLLSNPKLIATVVVLTVVVAVTLYFSNLIDDNARLKSSNKSLERQYESLMISLAEQKKLYIEAEKRRSEYVDRMVEIEKESSNFRACVASGKCGVRVKARCPTLPELPTDTGRIDSGTSELDTIVGFNLLDLREGIMKLESNYKLCQSELKARSIGN